MESVHESEVLKKLDPSIKDNEDSWPQFPLRDVSIVSQKTGRLISLLQAHKTGEVQVTGILHDQDADQESRKQFKKRYQKQQRVSISNVDMYSYGKYDDGSLAFWAAGEAGWFELRTLAQAYKPVYAQMEEATELLYFLTARAGRQRKAWRNATAKQVEDIMRVTFHAFQEEDSNKHRKDWQEVMDAFAEHRHFLVKCMLEGAEGVDWDNTPFLRWYEEKYPTDVAQIRGIVDQTGSGSIEDLLSNGTARPSSVSSKSRGRPPKEMAPEKDKPAMGRRSKRLAVDDEGNSSEELSNRRGRARGKHKRKSMLRIPGSAKTPKKTNAGPRYNTLVAVRDPDMDYFREQRKIEADGKEWVAERPPPDQLSPGFVHDLKYNKLDEETETIAPSDDYWSVKGPSGTWACPIDGCAHQVWDAETQAGHEMIKTHYAQTHQHSIEELIRSESRPWAKTSYLLEKVRNMKAQGQPVGETVKGRDGEVTYPAPIKRVLGR